jgi:hypothetical protein
MVHTRHKSPNCSEYNDHASTLFSFTVSDRSQQNLPEYESFMVSCQTTNYERPDRVTQNAIQEVSLNALQKQSVSQIDPNNLDITTSGVMLGTKSTDLSGSDIAFHRMASNCAPSFDLNKVTSYNQFQCNYLGTGVTETGRKVRNPFQTWKGTLPSCETSLELSDQTEEDIRKLVFHNAGGDDAQLNLEDFVCRVTSIPMQ